MQLSLEPFYLLDENMSPSFPTVFNTCGYNMVSIQEAFDGRRQVGEPEFIPWLAQHHLHKGVWVTEDVQAQKLHAKLISANQISALWILTPKGGLRGIQQLQLLASVIETVNTVVVATTVPVYFQASFNIMKPKLEQLVGPLTDKNAQFKRIPLNPF